MEALTAVTDAVALSSLDGQKLVVLVQSRQSCDDDDSQLRGQVNVVWNTDLVETMKVENQISQATQYLYSDEEHHESQNGRVLKQRRRWQAQAHWTPRKAASAIDAERVLISLSTLMLSHGRSRAHELPGARQRAVDEAHTLTIGCHARGERKGCVGIPRGDSECFEQEDSALLQFKHHKQSASTGVAQLEVILHNGSSLVMVFAETKREERMKEVEQLPAVTQEVLDQDKSYMCVHGVSLFVWDTAIEATAQSWADQGNYARLLGVDWSNRKRPMRNANVLCPARVKLTTSALLMQSLLS